MKKVSVILNSYNRLQWLELAVRSVAEQNYTGPTELVIVDDGSPEQQLIPKLAEPYRKENLSIKYALMPHCGNLAVRRNDGLDVATGEYICFLDDDNAYAPQKISMCYLHLETCDCDGVYHRTRELKMDGSIGDLVPFARGGGLGQVNMDAMKNIGNSIDGGEVMLRRSTLDKYGIFDEKCICLEDWDLWRRILLQGKMCPMLDMLSLYRFNNPKRRVFDFLSTEHRSRDYILEKKLGRWSVEVTIPNPESLTFTQRNFSKHVAQAFHDLGLSVSKIQGPDANFLLLPFRMDPINKLKMNGEKIITLHAEDPYAQFANVPFCNEGVDWVITNDEGCLPNYHSSRKSVLPSLLAFDFREPSKQKSIDILVVGTPFPERVSFIKSLAESAPDLTFTCYGKEGIPGINWKGLSPNVQWDEKIVSPSEMMDLGNSSKIILVLNRKTGENPVTPARGFVEASSGAMVLMDHSRPAIGRYFEIGKEMDVFKDIPEAVEKLHHYLIHQNDREEMARAGFLKSKKYTYKKCLQKVMNYLEADREFIL